jgi:DNA-binding beta-propeller fold protein YncE
MMWRLGLSAVLSVALGCSSGGASTATGGTGGEPSTSRLVVTADWLNQSLSVFDYDALIRGEEIDVSLIRVIDLASSAPGPLELEITPDGRRAVVASAPGFFDGNGVTNVLIGSPDVPPGGVLLIVDLETGESDAVATSDVPMGIAISSDGTTAYTANYGTIDAPGDTMSIVDLESGAVVDELTFGGRPEQVALSPSGELGVINIAGSNGGIHVFETADPEATMSPLLPTGNDPSDVTFLGDDTRVVVANSFSADVVLVDTSDPSSPTVITRVSVDSGVPYGVTYMPNRNQVLAPTGTGTTLVTIDVADDALTASAPLQLPGGTFPLTAAVDPGESHAFVAHIEDNSLSIVDLDTGDVRGLSWLDEPGPAYVAVEP